MQLMTQPDDSLLNLSQAARDAWPAAEIATVDGWLVRLTEGVTSRANSVWPNQTNGRLSLAQKLATVEQIYATHQQPAIYQISPLNQPPTLDEILAQRGYTAHSPTLVQTAVLPPTTSRPAPHLTLTLASTLTDEWLAAHILLGQYSPQIAAVRAAIMRRIQSPAAYVLAEQNGRLLGVGMGVCQNGWLGIFNMHTAAHARRQGVASAILDQLVHFGQKQHVRRAYLQVVASNQPARLLYQTFQFTTAYQYHYRQQPTG